MPSRSASAPPTSAASASLATAIPVSAASSPALGVNSVTWGARAASACSNAPANRTAPRDGWTIGSQTTGAAVRASARAIASATSLDPIMPIFTARTSMSDSRNSSCSRTRSAATGSASITAVVFWTVRAVTTPAGRQPSSDAMRTSAIRPAPPDGSRPAQISTSGAPASVAAAAAGAGAVTSRTPPGR